MGCKCSKSESPRYGHVPTLLTKQSREPAESLPADQKAVSCHASEGSRWHSELVSVSSELREKLQDPHFVACRCDLDGSGDMDPHELKQAARVYGISPSCKDHGHQQMAQQLPISKEDFADMVASHSQGSGHEAVAMFLVEYGADVKAAANKGSTALMGAARGNHETIVKFLLEKSADVKAASSDGWTALMYAARYSNETMVKLLLENSPTLPCSDISQSWEILGCSCWSGGTPWALAVVLVVVMAMAKALVKALVKALAK
eukprot:Skav201038  [mRNA]  locus=scaffold3386:215127:222643:+ [translate_table: standard]